MLVRAADGVGFVWRGIRFGFRRPGVMLIGILPAVVVFALLVASLWSFAWQAVSIASWLTPFADLWPSESAAALRYALAGALVLGGSVLAVLSYTSITVTLGTPAYNYVSAAVEAAAGGIARPVSRTWTQQLACALLDALRMLLSAVGIALLVFVISLLPVVGTVGAFVVGALLGGWLIAVELTGTAGDARGISLQDRRRLLRSHRGYALGFGVATYLLFLIPFAAVLLMPAAVAGATLLLRQLRGEPTHLR